MNTAVKTKITDKREDDEYPFRKKVRDYRKFGKFYLVPITSVGIFIIIFIFTIVPNIRYMFDGLQEVNSLRDESEKLDMRLNVLKTLKEKEDQDRRILSMINNLVPSETSEVVKFRQEVAEMGKQKGLVAESLKAGESILDDKNKSVIIQTPDYQVIEIPSKFSFLGQFSSYRELLRSLYNGDDFFVISSMDLEVNQSNGSGNIWRGDFDIIKYQFSLSSTEANYSQILESQPINQSVVRFLEENFAESDLN